MLFAEIINEILNAMSGYWIIVWSWNIYCFSRRFHKKIVLQITDKTPSKSYRSITWRN